MQQQVYTPPLFRDASRKVVSKKKLRYLSVLHSEQYRTRFCQKSVIYSFLRFSPFLLLRSLHNRPPPYRRMASPAKKTGGEQEDTDYDPEEEESGTGSPKKGRKKKEKPDPGLTMGADIEDFLQPDGKQVEIELSNVTIDQGKTKGQIRREDPKLLLKRIESLEAAPPTRPIHVVLWEDNSMFPTDCLSFLLREPSRMDPSTIHRWQLLVCIRTAQR